LKNTFTEMNQKEYGDNYPLIKFPSYDESSTFESKRNALLEQIKGKALWGYGDTKTDCNNLSEGCRLCGAGLWSCLFINGHCNCSCFYCPTRQDEDCLPTTNSVTFNSPEEYAEYVNEFSFKGVSISGGEPLLTPELTISYIKTVRNNCAPDMYIWMYTNGSLITKEILIQLRDAGLNEIRFDIGARNYDLENLKLAVGIIPVVTVEIPAVPEELNQMKEIIKQLAHMGVNHLNLHQLRLTPYNFDRLMKHDYTYIHNDKITVIESELTALELIDYVYEKNIKLAINYCSYPYKSRYQGLASRTRNGNYMIKPFENMTQDGFVRLINLKCNEEKISAIFSGISNENKHLVELNRDKKQISIHPSMLTIDVIDGCEMELSYFSAIQLQSVSYRNPFITVDLKGGKRIIIERFKALNTFSISNDNANDLIRHLSDCTPFNIDTLADILRHEQIETGLLPYI